jgi:hypothetical protein
MAVDIRLTNGAPRRMGPASFTLATTVEQATGGYNHRVVAVYGTEGIPTPGPNINQLYPVPPGPTGIAGKGSKYDKGHFYPTWSAVGPALPLLTVRPVGGGQPKPPFGGAAPAISSLPQDLVVTPKVAVRQGARQGRVTTAPKAQMRWVRQGG